MPPTAESTQDPNQRRSNTQRPILPKKCLYCERRFSKAEHLKRHQRSHTGERPYRCPRCQKCFSRSDVLIRHLKNHPHITGGNVEPSSSEGELGPVNAKKRASATSAVGAQMNDTLVSPIGDHYTRPLSPSRIDPALFDPPGQYHNQSEAHATASGLDHLALLASKQGWGNHSTDAPMTDTRHSATVKGPGPQDWGHEPPSDGHEFGSVRNYQQQRPTSSDSEFHMIAASDGPHDLGFSNDLYSGRLGAFQDLAYPVMGSVPASGSLISNELTNWFDQFDMGTNNEHDAFYKSEIPTHAASHQGRHQEALSLEAGHLTQSPSSGPVHSLIPTERFHSVERCWPNHPRNTTRLMPNLWRDIISNSEDNLLSKTNLIPEPIEHNKLDASLWRLDEGFLARLQKMFVGLSRKDTRRDSEGLSSFSRSSPSVKFSVTNIQEENLHIPDFLPAEIVYISLNLFWSQYHHSMPFIHKPTFCPQTTPSSILLAMCLIGLTILQTKGATAFVRQAFPKVLEKMCTEILTPPRERGCVDQLSSLASAVLILSLSEMTGEQAHQEQCQMLYSNAITTAQNLGLFSTVDAQSLEEHMFTSISNLDARWQAWARVESAKRLISCLTLVDTSYSAIYRTIPIIRTEDIKMILPCDISLFDAPTAAEWNYCILKGTRMCMPTFQMFSDRIVLPELDTTLDPHGMTGILCVVRLLISESFHRLLSEAPERAVDSSFVPWKAYESDNRAKVSQVFTTEITRYYGSMLLNTHPDCSILWHNMCIMLTADLRLVELGAGCSGAEAARAALDDISIWTQTPSARRACIHAAQTFKLASTRQPSEEDLFLTTTTSIFISALVLALYIFTTPPNTEVKHTTTPQFDLSDEIDWKAIDNEGLVEGSQTDASPATSFIRDGGLICFDGFIYHPGIESVKRILLLYATILEGFARSKVGVRRYCHVLRIVGDALEELGCE